MKQLKKLSKKVFNVIFITKILRNYKSLFHCQHLLSQFRHQHTLHALWYNYINKYLIMIPTFKEGGKQKSVCHAHSLMITAAHEYTQLIALFT